MHAAAHPDALTRDPAGSIRCDEGDNVGDIGRLAEATQGRGRSEIGHESFVLYIFADEVGFGRAGRHRVDRDATRAQSCGHGQRHRVYRRLGRGIATAVG